jgi:hypothetical protein
MTLTKKSGSRKKPVLMKSILGVKDELSPHVGHATALVETRAPRAIGARDKQETPFDVAMSCWART